MAIARLEITTQNRRTTTTHRKSAYISGTRLEDRLGVVADFRKKRGVIYSACRDAEGREIDRQAELMKWESAEKRKDAVISREIKISLPCELSREQNIALAEDIRTRLTAFFNVASSDMAVHYPPPEQRNRGRGGHENPHEHVLLPDRDVNGKKIGAWLYANPQAVLEIRQIWQDTCNEHLTHAGLSVRIDMRSYNAQIEEVRAEIAEEEAEIARIRQEIQNELERAGREAGVKLAPPAEPSPANPRPDGRTKRDVLSVSQPDGNAGGPRPAKTRPNDAHTEGHGGTTKNQSTDRVAFRATPTGIQPTGRREAQRHDDRHREAVGTRGERSGRASGRHAIAQGLAEGAYESALERLQEHLTTLERRMAITLQREKELLTIAEINRKYDQREEAHHAQEPTGPTYGTGGKRESHGREEEANQGAYAPAGSPRP